MYTHTYTPTLILTHVPILIHSHAHTLMHVHTDTLAYTLTCTHASLTLTFPHSQSHRHTLTNTYSHNLHTHLHLDTCTCTQCSRSHVLTLAHTRTRTLMRRCFEGGTSGRICWPRGVRRGRGFAHLRPGVWTRGRLRCCQRLRGRGGAWESAALSERASFLRFSPASSRFRYPLRMRRARPTPTAGVLPT